MSPSFVSLFLFIDNRLENTCLSFLFFLMSSFFSVSFKFHCFSFSFAFFPSSSLLAELRALSFICLFKAGSSLFLSLSLGFTRLPSLPDILWEASLILLLREASSSFPPASPTGHNKRRLLAHGSLLRLALPGSPTHFLPSFQSHCQRIQNWAFLWANNVRGLLTHCHAIHRSLNNSHAFRVIIMGVIIRLHEPSSRVRSIA